MGGWRETRTRRRTTHLAAHCRTYDDESVEPRRAAKSWMGIISGTRMVVSTRSESARMSWLDDERSFWNELTASSASSLHSALASA